MHNLPTLEYNYSMKDLLNMNIDEYVDNHKEEIINTLLKLISLPSPDGGETAAQSYVENYLQELGFETETFRGFFDKCQELSDYCPADITYHENCYNVAGKAKGSSHKPSLLLFAHIDTEREDYFGNFDNPYAAIRKDGKIHGLGASDDKGGVAMMLEAARIAKMFAGDFNYDLTILSILGKHGGAFGTLSALLKGYGADNCIYLHPAETGHGFAEIKNISLGIVDFDLETKGIKGAMHDDLDPGINANVVMIKLLNGLEEFNQQMRRDNIFDFGSFANQPSFILNIGSIHSEGGYGEVNASCKAKIRCRFFKPYEIDDIKELINQKIKETAVNEGYEGLYELRTGNFKATPAMVASDDEFIMLIKDAISCKTGIKDFIHQYHGGSDIRFPIIYGGSKCVGIGPSCILPVASSNKQEWIDENDYLNGVKIVADILLRLNKEE